MMTKTTGRHLFFSESSIGRHHSVPDLFFSSKDIQTDVATFTFFPSILVKEKRYAFPNIKEYRLNNILVSLDFSELIRQYDFYYIGYDYDREGEAMSRLLLDYLVEQGVNPINIIRVPLTEHGYIGFSSFWKDEQLERYIQDRMEEKIFFYDSKKVTKGFGVSRRTALIYNVFKNPPDAVENINADGTSSITYMFKKSIKEK